MTSAGTGLRYGDLLAVIVIGVLGMAFSTPAHGISCESLVSLPLNKGKITRAETVRSGGFILPPGQPAAERRVSYQDVPAFCRVSAALAPSSDSDIHMEVWMPASGWNGKFQAVGNGGWAGFISYGAMRDALLRGYATASTDTGHTGGTGSFALGHPEKLIDFGYRAVHEMTLKSKQIVQAFYGRPPQYSYWNGCSTGGREGLKEAQRYPDDYDGIIAGAPANPRTFLSSWQVWISQVALMDKARFIPPEKYGLIHKAVVNACDAVDGLKDGLIDDPRNCDFDPKILQCKTGDGPSCLTAAQVDTVKKLYSPLVSPRTGKVIYPGYEPGSEMSWGFLLKGPEPNSIPLDQYRYVVFKDPTWDWRSFKIDEDSARAAEVDGETINILNPNLGPFAAKGKKLLLYHGWNDGNVPPEATIRYYETVFEQNGGRERTASWIRLFMAPGMDHCRGGEGPNEFDTVNAMEQWVEHGKAPERIVASHSSGGKVDRTRPLCPYPQVARYRGSGSIDDAANFSCTLP